MLIACGVLELLAGDAAFADPAAQLQARPIWLASRFIQVLVLDSSNNEKHMEIGFCSGLWSSVQG